MRFIRYIAAKERAACDQTTQKAKTIRRPDSRLTRHTQRKRKCGWQHVHVAKHRMRKLTRFASCHKKAEEESFGEAEGICHQ